MKPIGIILLMLLQLFWFTTSSYAQNQESYDSDFQCSLCNNEDVDLSINFTNNYKRVVQDSREPYSDIDFKMSAGVVEAANPIIMVSGKKIKLKLSFTLKCLLPNPIYFQGISDDYSFQGPKDGSGNLLPINVDKQNGVTTFEVIVESEENLPLEKVDLFDLNIEWQYSQDQVIWVPLINSENEIYVTWNKPLPNLEKITLNNGEIVEVPFYAAPYGVADLIPPFQNSQLVSFFIDLLDCDGDGINNYVDVDTNGCEDINGDGICDYAENESLVDIDGDGIPNYADIDHYANGIDADNDGIVDINDIDYVPNQNDIDLNGIVDLHVIGNIGDIDNDGVFDSIDADQSCGADTDQDGILDYGDVDTYNNGIDFNGDGVDDRAYSWIIGDFDQNGIIDTYQSWTNNGLLDVDEDGISDEVDIDAPPKPNETDLNNNGIIDSYDDSIAGPNQFFLDADGDGIPTVVDAHEALGIDIDNDGIEDIFDASLVNGDDVNQDGILDVSSLLGKNIEKSKLITPFYLGCFWGKGLSTPSTIGEAIWGEFNTQSVESQNGDVLSYYKDWQTEYINFEALLKHKDSQCYAWVELFLESLKHQGFTDTRRVLIKAKENATLMETPQFFIKNWNFSQSACAIFSSPTLEASEGYIYQILSPIQLKSNLESNYDVISNCSDLIKLEGKGGQNNFNPLADFKRHEIALWNGHIYDPSYGGHTPMDYSNGNYLLNYENQTITGYFLEEEIDIDENQIQIDLNNDGVLTSYGGYIYYVKENDENELELIESIETY